MVNAQLPLAPRKDGEGLAFLGLAAEHVSHRLTTRPAGWQSGLAIDFSEQLPVTVSHLLENDIATGVRTHTSIVVQPCRRLRQRTSIAWIPGARSTPVWVSLPNPDPA